MIERRSTTDIRRSGDGAVAAILTARASGAPASAEQGLDIWRPVPDLRFCYARMSPDGRWRVHPLARAGADRVPALPV